MNTMRSYQGIGKFAGGAESEDPQDLGAGIGPTTHTPESAPADDPVRATGAAMRNAMGASMAKANQENIFRRVLGMGMKGVKLFEQDAVKRMGKGVLEWLPPKEFYYDDNGRFNAMNWYKHASVGLIEYDKRMKAQHEAESERQRTQQFIQGSAGAQDRRTAIEQGGAAADYQFPEGVGAGDYIGAIPTSLQQQQEKRRGQQQGQSSGLRQRDQYLQERSKAEATAKNALMKRDKIKKAADMEAEELAETEKRIETIQQQLNNAYTEDETKDKLIKDLESAKAKVKKLLTSSLGDQLQAAQAELDRAEGIAQQLRAGGGQRSLQQIEADYDEGIDQDAYREAAIDWLVDQGLKNPDEKTISNVMASPKFKKYFQSTQ